MAVGATDPVLGPPVMAKVRTGIRGCPGLTCIRRPGISSGGGEEIAARAVHAFGA